MKSSYPTSITGFIVILNPIPAFISAVRITVLIIGTPVGLAAWLGRN